MVVENEFEEWVMKLKLRVDDDLVFGFEDWMVLNDLKI